MAENQSHPPNDTDNQDVTKDFLTGFYTRESLAQTVNKLIAGYQNSRGTFALLLIDIDYFKTFNDKYGHLLGDEVLKYFSSSIRLDLVTQQASYFRFGGDELLVVFRTATSDEAYGLAVRLLENIKHRPCNLRGNQLQMSFSGGVAAYPADGKTIEDLLENADKALYVSKRNGRGQVTQYGKIWMKSLKRVQRIGIIALAVLLIAAAVHLNFQEKISNVAQKVATILSQRRKDLSEKLSRAKDSLKDEVRKLQDPEIDAALKSATAGIPKPEPPVPSPVSAPAAAVLDIVYLKDGGVIRGRIVSENAERLKIQLDLRSGHATVAVEKDRIERIERGAG